MRGSSASSAGGGLSVYTVYDDAESADAGDSEAVQVGKSLVNALIIVCVLAGATFGIVLLYKVSHRRSACATTHPPLEHTAGGRERERETLPKRRWV